MLLSLLLAASWANSGQLMSGQWPVASGQSVSGRWPVAGGQLGSEEPIQAPGTEGFHQDLPIAISNGRLIFPEPKQFDFYAQGPYDSNIPKPESILHYGPGEHTTTFRDQEAVLSAIVAKAKDRVHVVEYGRSVEGRPLRIYVISSPRNLSHLDDIQKEHLAIANGKGDAGKTVPIVWINECIHGDETASFESAMWTTYTLVASQNRGVRDALDKEIVILNPVYNPDGHERYAVYYNSVATGSPDPQAFENNQPRAISGRLNHYRFDMNRDRVAFSQDETRQEFAEMLRWNPQVYIDQHGQVSSYFFPPEPMSINPNVDRERNAKWTDIFGRATGKAFEDNGFSYFVKDTFDLYYPGYIDSSNTLSGAIGMTHETDGGRVLAHLREDGSTITLRQGVAKHCTSALAVVETAAAHAKDLLASYADFKKRANSGIAAGKFQRVVVTANDGRPIVRLRDQLAFAGIKSTITGKPLMQQDATDYLTGKRGKHDFPAWSLVIDMAQPQGALAKALLEPGQSFESEFIKAQTGKKKTAPDGETYPGPDASEFYDLTGWSLPLAHGLSAYWCENRGPEDLSPQFGLIPRLPGSVRTSTIGYAIDYRDQEDILAVADALALGARGMVSNKEMSLGKAKLPRGTFLFLADHNDENLQFALTAATERHHSRLIPLTTEYPDEGTRSGPGSESTSMLKPPKIGVAFGNGENLGSVGGIWFLMDREFHLPFTALSSNALNGDISKYTTLVVPGGAGVSASAKLREWVSAGGSLVVLENPGWVLGSSGFVSLDSVHGDFQELPGALFKAELDPRSFLSYGYAEPAGGGKIPLAIPIGGSNFYQIRKEGGSVLTLSTDPKEQKLLSGWEWPDETEKALAGTVWLQDTPIGRGHVITFLTDPTDRAMWPGMYKLLLNAMILGPG